MSSTTGIHIAGRWQPGAAGIERYGALRVRARVNTVLATEDGRPHRLRAGESMDLDWHLSLIHI